MAGYNRTREVEQLLQKTESLPPSFTVHLHAEYWILNNGSKFLYHNQIASLLDDIRAHRIPVDFLELFDSARVPFYDGCMIVELLDYRPQKSQEPALKTPQKTRVVLHPNPETLWADLCSLNQRNGVKWTDRDALEVEAKLLLATAPPLCLDPDPHLTRVVNHVVRVSTPSMPLSLKRKAATMEPEENGPEKAKRERLMAFMAPRDNRHAPSYRLLDAIQTSKKAAAEAQQAQPMSLPGNQYMNVNPQPTQQNTSQPHAQSPTALTPAPPASQSHSPADLTDTKTQKLMMKIHTPQMPQYNVAFVQSNGSHTPVPPQPTTHQFVNQHPPPVATAPSLQPQVYPNFQAATEAAKRSLTPAPPQHQPQQPLLFQQQYIQQFQTQQHPQQQPQQLQQPQPQPQSQQQRPPSQPQHSLVQQHQPQPTPQQMQPPQQGYAQSPKTPAPVSAASPARTQPTPQPYNKTPTQFQPPLPTANFLQPPPGPRSISKPQAVNGNPQQQQPQQPGPTQTGGHPSQAQIQQIIYTQQIQQSQHQLQQQHAVSLMQQRIAAANAQKNGGGRTTPQVQSVQMQQNQGQGQMQMQQQGQGQLQPPQPPRQSTGTPSPVRNSPMVTHQQLQAAAAARSSPMPAKAQILQQAQSQQQSQIPQQHSLAPQGGHMQGTRVEFQAPYNPSQLRPNMAHGTPQQAHLMLPPQGTQNGMPTMAAASPRMNVRPITPAIGIVGPDGKPQQQQGLQGGMQMPSQLPIRRQTPLQQAQQQLHIQQQQQQAMSPRIQHASQAQMQAQMQVQQQQQHPGAQQQQQPQLVQTQSSQNPTQTPMQQSAHLPQQQQQQMAQQYAQMYNYQQQYWRANATPQQQQQMQQFLQQRLSQQQQQQLQQQQQHAVSGGQNIMLNGSHQTAVPVGLSMQAPAMTPQHAAAMMKAAALQQQQQAAMSMGGGGPGVGPPSQQTMVAKMMPTQTPAQMQAQAMGKGKAGPKKGVPAKKGPPQR